MGVADCEVRRPIVNGGHRQTNYMTVHSVICISIKVM